jgi:hypothetical protein
MKHTKENSAFLLKLTLFKLDKITNKGDQDIKNERSSTMYDPRK